MRLSYDVIKEALARRFCIIDCKGEGLALFSVPVLNSANEREQIGRSFLIAPGTPALHRPNGGLYICIGEPSRRYTKNSYLVIDSREDVLDVYNYLVCLFRDFEEWDVAVRNIAEQGGSPQKIMELSVNLAGNPLAFLDNELHEFALALPEQMDNDSGIDSLIGQQGSLLVEQMDFDNLKTAIDSKELFVAKTQDASTGVEHRLLCASIYEREFLGVLIMRVAEEEINETHRFLLNALREHFLRRNHVIVGTERESSSSVHSVLRTMLSDTASVSSSTCRQLDQCGLPRRASYACALVSFDERSEDKPLRQAPIRYLCEKVEERNEAVVAVCFGELMVLLADTTHIDILDPCVIDELLCPFAGLPTTVGISDRFKDIALFERSYRQAKAALAMADFNDVAVFRDVAIRYVLTYGVESLGLDALCARGIVQLSEYDIRNGTELVQTISVYLHEGMNATKAAKHLGVYRSTLLSRLDRITSITGLSLDDHEDRLYLSLSLELLRQS